MASFPFQGFPGVDELCTWLSEEGFQCSSATNSHGKFRKIKNKDLTHFMGEPGPGESVSPAVLKALEEAFGIATPWTFERDDWIKELERRRSNA